MVRVTQTEEEIKIVIELNRLVNKRPDIVLLPRYLKFNSPPIFFERHLTDEIDEVASFCRIFKREARIVLLKKNKGLWPEIFENLSKEELNKRRLELSDIIIERNQERDKELLKRFDDKKREEINKEVCRETVIRERVKTFEAQSCKQVVGVKKETCVKPVDEKMIERKKVLSASIANTNPKPQPKIRLPIQVRPKGKIGFNFSTFGPKTPKRESQKGQPFPPFAMGKAEKTKEELEKAQKDNMTAVD